MPKGLEEDMDRIRDDAVNVCLDFKSGVHKIRVPGDQGVPDTVGTRHGCSFPFQNPMVVLLHPQLSRPRPVCVCVCVMNCCCDRFFTCA